MCLRSSHLSAWTLLYKYATDKKLLDVTTLTRSVFNLLLDRFAEFYPINRAGPCGGRPLKLVYHHQVLRLPMHYYEGSMGLKSLCEVHHRHCSERSPERKRLCRHP
ncbi:hypothetical protein PC117_g13145 [Phytophthora cactorum]|uniref:Uncharacterized protein n=1 Tax=Phytophthora cactorum TaxID=29920 RepID=A0A8T1D3K6_9STRA|nr:hypothetical protein PC117_g13145 [Phytophthora cactorum]